MASTPTIALPREARDLISAATALIDSVPRGTPERRRTDHTVGSAALASDGKIYTGINVFHFSGGPCAENIAFGQAAAAGVASAMSPGVLSSSTGVAPTLELVVAVANDGRGVINPCGRCRQMMVDYYPGLKVIVKVGEGGAGVEPELRIVGLQELLPFAYISPVWKA